MKLFLAALACSAAVALASPAPPRSFPSRDPRFFFVYTVPASACQTGVATYPTGSCYTAADCTKLGGVSSVPCENNLGTCCYFRKTCAQTITRNQTLFTNQNYPSSNTATSTCTTTIDLLGTNVCQLKLEFLVLELANPTSGGVCATDHLQILGSTTPNTPLFCGTKTGQSVIVNVNRLGADPMMRVTLGAGTTNRRWSIRVTQTPCDGNVVTGVTFPTTTSTTTTKTTTTTTTTTTPAPVVVSGVRCVSTSSISPMGSCYPSATCTAHGGTAAGPCPASQVCCVFVKNCGQDISRNMTSFVSANFPAYTTAASTCTATVKRIGTGICQLKLGFTSFELQPASSDGSCLVDSLEVVGSTTPNTPKFCDVKSGQTQFFNISSTGADPQLKITTGSASNANRRWNLNVTQIFCNSTEKGKAEFSIQPLTCTSTSTLSPTGTCYSAANCTAKGGQVGGTCADGNGVCCFFTKQCGGTIATNETNFVNSGFPGANGAESPAKACSAKVTLLDKNICQLRLDFTEFELAQPTAATGVCTSDFMEITGTASTNVPKICGQNKGQHVIVDVTSTSTPEIKITVGTEATTFRKWNIKVTQIYCNSTLKAPTGCLQYFTEPAGEIKSFNYKQATLANIGATPPAVNVHLASLNYQACVRKAAGMCKIQWGPPAGAETTSTSFIMSRDAVAKTAEIGKTAGVQQGGCVDYVGIPSGTLSGAAATSDRFCGVHLPAITTTAQPFSLRVVTSADEKNPAAGTPPKPVDDDKANTGFHFAYSQTATGC